MTILDDMNDAMAKIEAAKKAAPTYAFRTRELADRFIEACRATGLPIDDDHVIVSPAIPRDQCIVMRPHESFIEPR